MLFRSEKISLDVVSSGSDISFPEIFKDKDDAEAKTGIYSSLNLLRNPGFEDLAEGDDMVGVDTYIPAIWQCANFGLTGAKTLVFSYYDPGTWGAMAEEIEGKGALQHHGWSDGSGKYFFQKIESGLESDNIYSLSFLTWNHGDTFTGTYTAKFGYDENDDSIATITWSQPTDSAYQKKEHSYVFKTGDIDNSKPIYFTITRNENVIAHFDRMTLVKATSSSINPGLNVSGVSSVKFEDGTAYAPKVVLADGEIFDFSGYIVNPDMDDRDGRYAIGWSGTNRTNNGEQFDGATNSYYLDDWNGDANLEYDCYQKLTNLVNGIYRLEVCARANDDTFVIYATTKAGEFSVPIINHSNGVDEDLSTLGKGWNKHIINDIKVVDGNMTIGGKGVATKTSAWLSMDEFRLYYISAITESEVVVALAENLQKYIDEVPDIIYNMREYLPQRIQDYVTSVKEEAVKALNDGERTQETIQTAHDNLLAAVASDRKSVV